MGSLNLTRISTPDLLTRLNEDLGLGLTSIEYLPMTLLYAHGISVLRLSRQEWAATVDDPTDDMDAFYLHGPTPQVAAAKVLLFATHGSTFLPEREDLCT